jgi:DHA1 family chloramphenicol resistance protein-like MFS transporter
MALGSRNWLVALLSAAVFSSVTVAVMMGPLLVALAGAFSTSVAGAGQLAAAIGISWGITAPLVGPVSDICGRRRVALTGVALMTAGTLGSLLVWDYWGLLGCRLLTGVGAAMIPPNSMATIADHFAPMERGRPISLLISASCVGYVIGMPAVAAIGAFGGWRLPFVVVGAFLAVLLAWHWVAFPRTAVARRAVGFRAHFREVGQSTIFWFVLAANVLYRTASFAVFTYLVAFLLQAYGMSQGQTALPLGLVGFGAMFGSILGGYVAAWPGRLGWAACGLVAGGVCIGVALDGSLAPWTAVLVGFVGMVMLTIFEPISWVVTAELAGESRATANGLLATSNQVGIIGGGSLAGLVLMFGSFPMVGFFCAGVATVAGAIVIGIAVGLRPRQLVRI